MILYNYNIILYISITLLSFTLFNSYFYPSTCLLYLHAFYVIPRLGGESLPQSQHITTNKRLRPITVFRPMRMNHIMRQLMCNNSEPINRCIPRMSRLPLPSMQLQKVSNIEEQRSSQIKRNCLPSGVPK